MMSLRTLRDHMLNYIAMFLVTALVMTALLLSALRGFLYNLDTFQGWVNEYIFSEFDIALDFGPISSEFYAEGIRLNFQNLQIAP
ncbi:MAG: hypothetical protein ISP86_01020, partial [Shewanellaceae bacterium]|nr:hypothetical protein [Shewanellaceae bacterium]